MCQYIGTLDVLLKKKQLQQFSGGLKRHIQIHRALLFRLMSQKSGSRQLNQGINFAWKTGSSIP